MCGARRQQRQFLHVGPEQNIGELGVRTGEQVEQPFVILRQTHVLHNAWIGHVRVDQKHRAVDFQGNAHRQIERDEGLALGRYRAGDHDEIGALGPRTGVLASVPDDRSFDDAKLVGDL